MSGTINVVDLLKNIIDNSPFKGKIYLVGGCVRDMLLNKQPKDYDMFLEGIDSELFENWLKVNEPDRCSSFSEYNKVKSFVLKNKELPQAVIEYTSSPSLSSDAYSRDFTINALYKNITTGEIIDGVGKGLEDLIDNRLIRLTQPRAFIENPTRLLRAIRFCSVLDFSLETETAQKLVPTESYEKLPKEHYRGEFLKILMSQNPVKGIKLLHDFGLLKRICEPLVEAWEFDQTSKYHNLNLTDHLFAVLEKVMKSKNGDNYILRLAALFHDIAKYRIYTFDGTCKHYKNHDLYSASAAEMIMRKLGFLDSTIQDVKTLIRNHMVFKSSYSYTTKEWTGKDKTLVKISQRLGDLMELELDLIEADNMSHAPNFCMPGQIDSIRRKLKEIEERKLILGMGQNGAEISGDTIMREFGIGPGISVREIKQELKELSILHPDKDLNTIIKLYRLRLDNKRIRVKKEYGKLYISLDKSSPCYIEWPNDPRFFQLKEGEDMVELAERLPNIYYYLEREEELRQYTNNLSPILEKIESMEGFRKLNLKLSNHDLSITVAWDDGTESTII